MRLKKACYYIRMAKEKNRILVVEDDKFIGKAYKAGLEKAGFEVISATNGEEAIKLIREDRIELVLLDLILPKKSGFDVLADIKLDSEIEKVPVIVLSNLGQGSDLEKAKSLGAVDYFVKSNITLAEVVEKIKLYIAGKQ